MLVALVGVGFFAGSAVQPATAATLGYSAPKLVSTQMPYGSPAGIAGLACNESLGCVAVTSDGKFTRSAAPQTGPASWSPTAGIDSRFAVADAFSPLSCPTASFCVVAGSDGRIARTTSPFSAAPSWSLSALPLRDLGGYTDTPTAIDCPTTDFCAVVGGDGVYVSANTADPAPTWRQTLISSSPLTSIKCLSATLCLAGDQDGGIWSSADPASNGASWTRRLVNSGYAITSIACPSATLCVAAADGGRVGTTTDPLGGLWTFRQVHEPYLTISQISCPSVSFCAAVSYSDNEVITTSDPTQSGYWAATTSVDNAGGVQRAALRHIACASTSLCVVGDSQGNIAATATPAGDASAWPLGKLYDAGTTAFTGISCPSASMCAAIDEAGRVHTSTTPTNLSSWSGTQAASDRLSAIDCPSVSLCVAVGALGVYATSTPTAAGSWTHTTVPGDAYNDLACPTVSLCVAVSAAGAAYVSTNPGAATPIWTKTQLTPSGESLAVLACASTTCVASVGDGDPVSYVTTNAASGTWTSMPGRYAELACPSASACIGFREDGSVYTSTTPAVAASWQNVSSVSAPGTYLGHIQASCPSTALCTLVPGRSGSSRKMNARAVTQILEPFSATPTVATDVIDADAEVNAVDCASDSLCIVGDLKGALLAGTPGGAGPPANITAPNISGTPARGQTLTCAKGAWTNGPTLAVQWLRDAAAIPSATAAAYTVTADDVGHTLACQVTATGSGGSDTATSAAVAVGGDSTAPTITVTTPAEGQHFTQGQAVSSDFSCQDASGITTCTAPTTVDTTTTGARTFTVNATDTAGNTTTKTVSYIVDPRPDPAGPGNVDPPAPPPTTGTSPAPDNPPATNTPTVPVQPVVLKTAAPRLLGGPTTSVDRTGSFPTTLKCAGPAVCVGSVSLSVLSVTVSPTTKKKTIKSIVVARASYKINPGASRKLKLKLNPIGRKQLRKAHNRLKATLAARPRNGAPASTRKVTLTTGKP